MSSPSSGAFALSNKDLVSFIFDDPSYDVNRPVYIDPKNPSIYLSHNSAKDLVRKLIAGLHVAGVRPGDTVCLHSFNSVWYPILVLAIVGTGAFSVSTNPGYTRGELNHAIKVAKVKYVLTEPEIFSNMLQALNDNAIDVKQNVFVLDMQDGDSVPKGMRSWRALLEHGYRDWIRFDDKERAVNTVSQLFYTSGTTGLPKCAMVTHQNFVAEYQLCYEELLRPYPVRVGACMPFFHMGAAPHVIVAALKEGWETYVLRRFELQPYLEYHSRYQLTEILAVPPMIIAVVMSGLSDPSSQTYNPEYSLRSVRNAWIGAAPLSADMQRRLNKLLGDGATCSQVWGMTETSSIATLMPQDMARKCARGEIDAWGKVGKPVDCVSIKLADEDGKDVTEKGRGELCIKGPIVVKGYFDNEKATKESWDAEGYFKTGDVVEIDRDTGLLEVVDRVKELIKVRGYQVAPPELEGALNEHPEIIDAAVIGVKDISGNEAPRAYVVRRPGSSLSKQAVHKHMRGRLSGYKQLTGGIEFVESVPKSPSGKILKRVLREMAKQKSVAKDGPKL